MKKVNIQFFSTLNENVKFISEMLENGYNVLLRIDEAKLNIPIDSDNINSIKEILFEGNVSYWDSVVYFSDSEFYFNEAFNLFSLHNPNTLFLKIGEHNENYLTESVLATSKIFNNEVLSLDFFRIGQKLKKNTKCGGVLLVDDVKTEKVDKRVRYTNGAFEFNRNGGRVYQYNPNIHFKLGVMVQIS